MEMETLKFIGVGLTAFGMLGAAIGVGLIFSAFLGGIARNPAASGKLFVPALVGAAFAEFMGLLAFVVAIMILFNVGGEKAAEKTAEAHKTSVESSEKPEKSR